MSLQTKVEQACQIQYPISVQLESSNGSPEFVSRLSIGIEQSLNSKNKSPLYSFYVARNNSTHPASSVALDNKALVVHVDSDPKIKSTQVSIESWEPSLKIKYQPGKSDDTVTLAPFIADRLHDMFAEEQQQTAYLLHDSPFRDKSTARRLTPENKAAMDTQSLRAFKYASTYHLTFSLFTASAAPSEWSIEDAIHNYLQPLLDQLEHISHVTVDTQVQLYASFSPSIAGPQYDSSKREWALQKSDLSGFVNAAEWPLSPGIGAGPTINFVLYIPAKSQSPLVLAETGGSSWLIPQWGGVQILNPTDKQRSKLTPEDLRPAILTFAEQLTSLLGVPQTPPSLSLRVASLTRERTTSLIISASSTLGALARLTLKLTSIAIPDAVAKSVEESISRLYRSCDDLENGRYQSALENARVAEIEAERAFFEPSMVGQVYFPEEHKVAVYVPLLGPMAVPLVMAGIKELRKLRRSKSKTS